MEDAELTRLAIEEIVRGMEELKEPQVLERKINPIAKPNKRFLGRTLNSMISHNKRTNDRTQANCRRKLKELDERQKLTRAMASRSRGGSWELVLSSSSDDDYPRDVRKRRKSRDKTKPKKYKKRKKGSKSKKHKSNRRDCSSSSESSSSTDNSCKRSQKNRKRKFLKHKKHKKDLETNIQETPDMYYEAEVNDAIQLDAALWANNYRQHQMQQLLYYSALMAGQESAEIEALKEELLTSDAEVGDTKIEKTSAFVEKSTLNSNDSESGESEVLQISLSSASSTSSEAKGSKILHKNSGKENGEKKEEDSNDSSNDVIWNLDTDSSTDNCCAEENNNKREQQQTDDECICITSESESVSDDDSVSDNTASVSDNEIEKLSTVANKLCQTAAETVTLLSSSDSEVEIISSDCVDEAAQTNTDTETRNLSPTSVEQSQELVAKCDKYSNSEVSENNESNTPLIAIVESISIGKEPVDVLDNKNMTSINNSAKSSSIVKDSEESDEVMVESENYLHSEVSITEENGSSPTESKSILILDTNFSSHSEDTIVVEKKAVEAKESDKTSNISFSLPESTPTSSNTYTEQQVAPTKNHIINDTKNSSCIIKPIEESAVNTESLSTLDGITRGSSNADVSEAVIGSKLNLTEANVNDKVVNKSGKEEIDETGNSLLTTSPLDVPNNLPLSASMPTTPPSSFATDASVVTESVSGSTYNLNPSETNLTESAGDLINL